MYFIHFIYNGKLKKKIQLTNKYLYINNDKVYNLNQIIDI